MKLFMVLAALMATSVPAHADLAKLIQIAPGVYRGDQPDTDADYATLARMGVRTIINLRNDEAVQMERETARRFGMRFLSRPMSAFTYPDERTVESVLVAMSDPKQQPVYIHCQYGKDRTGLIAGLYRVYFQNWSSADAYAEMRAMGFNPLLLNLVIYFEAHTWWF